MTDRTQLPANCRSPRVQPADITPAVLRLPDGRGSRGKLETVSLTGGLLSLPNILDRGSRITLMFLTHTGAVSGAAEMLSPVSATRQPFRFVAIEESDQRRLRAAVRSSFDRNPGQTCDEQAWIEKYRAALAGQESPRRRVFRVVFGALTLLTLCLGTAIYVLHFR